MINVRMPEDTHDLKPRITVVGVGGAGGNAVNNMIRSQLEGVEFLVTNTDSQALKGNIAENKVQLGVNITGGLGAGSRPDIGRAAAEESLDEVVSRIEGSNMVFVTAGMGGGTGSGAAPVLAQAARDQGVLTVGVVTKPFHFEGAHRMKIAEEAIKEMQDYVDTLIVIPNQNLFRIANEKTTFADAFRMADEVLQSGVRGVTDLMVMPGLINLDFADIRTVMAEMGKAMMGTGEASGEKRSLEAAEAAISNPLLDDVSLKGARGVLINITGGMDMTLFEVDEAVVRIKEEVDQDANIIFGSAFDETMEGVMRVSVVATGIDSEAAREARPSPLNTVTEATRRGVTGGGNPGMTAPVAKTGTATNASTGSGAGFTRSGSLPGGTPPAHVASSAMGGGMGAPAGATQPTAKSGGSTPMMGGGARPAQAEPTMTRGHAATAAAPVTMTATAEKLEVEEDIVVAEEEELLTPLERHVEATRKAETERSDMIPKFTRPAPRDPAGPRFEEEGEDAFTATGSRPMAQRYGESFIPPEPVDAGKTQGGTTAQQSSPAPSKADPFAEADMDNAGRQPAEQPAAKAKEPAQQKRSLFERFTSRKESEGPSNPAEEQIMAKLQRNAEKEQQQPSMSVDSAEARTRKQGEDELDIPAFLRRQAN